MKRTARILFFGLISLSISASAQFETAPARRVKKPTPTPPVSEPAAPVEPAASKAAGAFGPGAAFWRLPKSGKGRLQANFRYGTGSANTTTTVDFGGLLGKQSSTKSTSYSATVFEFDYFKNIGSMSVGGFTDTGTETYSSGSSSTTFSGLSDLHFGVKNVKSAGGGTGFYYEGFLGFSPGNRTSSNRYSGGLSLVPGGGYQMPMNGNTLGFKGSYTYRMEQTAEASNGQTSKYSGGNVLFLGAFYELPWDKNRVDATFGFKSTDDIKSSTGAKAVAGGTDILFGGTVFMPMESLQLMLAYNGAYRSAKEEISSTTVTVKTDAYLIHSLYAGVILGL